MIDGVSVALSERVSLWGLLVAAVGRWEDIKACHYMWISFQSKETHHYETDRHEVGCQPSFR